MSSYLAELSRAVTAITVVDGSTPERRRVHEAQWGAHARVVEPDLGAVVTAPQEAGGSRRALNGKVLGAMTGIRQARHDAVVLADDDVRHTCDTLARLVEALDRADLVRPVNVYEAWPWQARWDGARTLVNLALGTDWPGTFALRRSTVVRVGGWSPEVLFENLELWRTVEVAGHVTESLTDVRVPREPPSVRQFWSQRVRQAYDDLAQPSRLVAELSILPVTALAARRGPVPLAVLAALGVTVAARGRRRLGADVVPPDVPLWAPVWLLERGVCTWLALGSRLHGGVRYHGTRVRVAAHSHVWLRRSRREHALGAPGDEGQSYPMRRNPHQAFGRGLSPRPVGTPTP
ncbi:MAG: glycosyltransferase family 2 protein [Dermatophilaceae bacterium]|nr:glycosyltransferase family 2 protein [Dermatophilaceae bacterium]NUR79645.1 glycosyltransferase family 2 protein [Dermatophilaceae bacterium]